jgi:hypothetical protein
MCEAIYKYADPYARVRVHVRLIVYKKFNKNEKKECHSGLTSNGFQDCKYEPEYKYKCK